MPKFWGQYSIKDQIIEGLLDGDIVEDFLKEKNLTLETTVAKFRAQEAARRQRAEIAGSSPHVQGVHRICPLPSRSPVDRVCPGCGSAPHPGGRQQCPARSLTCHFCKKPGHLMKVCRQRKGWPQSAMAVHATPLGEDIPEVNASGTPPVLMLCLEYMSMYHP